MRTFDWSSFKRSFVYGLIAAMLTAGVVGLLGLFSDPAYVAEWLASLPAYVQTAVVTFVTAAAAGALRALDGRFAK